MNQNEMIPADVQAKITEMFKSRMKMFDIKPTSKKYIDAQGEFFSGAVTAIDAALGNTNSCLPPGWYIAILRGDIID